MKPHFQALIGLLLFFFSFSIQAQDSIRFDESRLELVLQRAKIANKPIFYMVYANWCPHCKNIKATTLKDAEVVSFMNTNYVFAGLNFEKPGSEDFKTKVKTIFHHLTKDELIEKVLANHIAQKSISNTKQDSSNKKNRK